MSGDLSLYRRSREMLLGEDAGLGDHHAVAVLVPHGADEGSDHLCELVSRPHGAEYLGKRAQDEDSLSNRTSELGRGGIFAVYVDGVVVIRKFCIDLGVFLGEDGVVVIGVVFLDHNMKILD